MVKRLLAAATLATAVGATLVGCGAKGPAASGSAASPGSTTCPAPGVTLPGFARALGNQVVGHAVVVCTPFPGTGVMKPRRFVMTADWVRVLAVDGLPLPASLNMRPDLPQKLQRKTYCVEDANQPFDVQVSGRWYAARAVSCTTNA